MSPWILASRPKTLPAAVAPVIAGCAVAWKYAGVFHLGLALCTLLSAVAIQIAANFFNDALDFAKGADTEKRLGPLRPTSVGLVSARGMMLAAAMALLAACLLAWPLIQARGWPILAIGLPSLYFSYGYTGGPLPLAYRGLGDLWVLLFFGLIAVSGTLFVQTGQWPPHGWIAGAQIGFLSTVLIAINNLRDHEEDTSTGKRTLAVRLGPTFARAEITFLCLAPHVAGAVFWPELGWKKAALFPLPTALLGWYIARRVWRTPPSAAYNKYLALSAAQLVLFMLLLTWACLA